MKIKKNVNLLLMIVGILPLFSGFSLAEAQDKSPTTKGYFSYQSDDSYEGKLPTAGEFFGIPLGDRFTSHRDVIDYCKAIAEKSPRVSVQKYGVSSEGRELILLMISSADNISRLEEIRESQMLLADPIKMERSVDQNLEGVLKELPAIVWLSYNVHGDESSPTEAALATLHQLADGSGERMEGIRENTLVILDPLLNPDGRERYLQWYHSVQSNPPNPDPAAREHSPPSPSGRTNHYYFDLNRDWAWQSQIETRQRIREYLRWQPLVHVDFHEMSPSSSYFFFPPEEPINGNIPRERVDWSTTFGKSNAEAFDRFGWKYYTGEQFDLFYPAYGDSWPSLNGSIGMTYEQAGGGRAGLVYRRSDGDLLTLGDRLHHHHVAGLATVECAADHRKKLQEEFFLFREQTIFAGRNGDVSQYVLPPSEDDHRRLALIDLLQRQGIELLQNMDETVAEGLKSHSGEMLPVRKLPPGTVFVPLDQAQGRLAKTLLENHAEAADAYFYDVAAWSLPLTYGVETLVAPNPVNTILIPFSGGNPEAGRVEERGRLAYLHRWTGLPSAKALRALQEAGESVDLVTQPIEIQGESYPAGTLIVRVDGEETHEAVLKTAQATGTLFRGTSSGWTDIGPDLGSDQFPELAHAKIAVLGPDAVSSGSYGAVWSFLEQEMGIPFTAISASGLRRSLDDFDVLVIPGGMGSSAMGEETLSSVKSWVRSGGVCIALGSSAFRIGGKDGLISRATKETQRNPKEKEPKRRSRSEIREERRQQQVPGNIVSIDLDTEHPLSFGMPEKIHGMISSTRIFKLEGDGSDVGVLPGTSPVVSGFISDENQTQLSGGVWLVAESSGRGQVILFAGDPLFRSFWRQTSEVFLNALLLFAR
ncbi:MAG: hypothetical protein ISR35_06200 [Planctomycetes bacterium]|nr:hypothetical protein [Planctomycetota bacterium]